MPELGNRAEWEAKLAKELGKLLRRTSGEILELLGDPPSIDNIPISYWDEIGEKTSSILKKFFRRIYLAAAEELLGSQPIGVDWGLVNEAAAAWAESASLDLITKLTRTNKRIVQKAVSTFFTEEQTLGELQAALLDAFGPVRAEMIAATEVTNAAFEGEFGIIKELANEGATSVAIWQTENDEFVDDEICEPLHNVEASGYDPDGRPYWIHPDPKIGKLGPPAVHTRCRCNVRWDFSLTPETISA